MTGTSTKFLPCKKRSKNQQSKITLIILGIYDNLYQSFFFHFSFSLIWGLHKVAFYIPLCLRIIFSNEFFCAFWDCVEPSHVLNFLCVWHVLKTWCLWLMEKIKDVEMKCAIFNSLHLMMFMFINLGETIKLFKSHGREKVECFNNLKPGDKWS